MAQSRQTLDPIEFRSPIAKVTSDNLRDLLSGLRGGAGITDLPLIFDQVWQRRLKQLWLFVSQEVLMLPVLAGRAVTIADFGSILLCVGTITMTLPTKSSPGDSYFFFNDGAGVVTIAGNINGSPAGYTLNAQYDYVEVTSKDGINWIVTRNN